MHNMAHIDKIIICIDAFFSYINFVSKSHYARLSVHLSLCSSVTFPVIVILPNCWS